MQGAPIPEHMLANEEESQPWPMHALVARIFGNCRQQFQVGFGCVVYTGLSPTDIEIAARAHAIELTPELLADLRTMEAAAVSALNEK